ncbi:MAG: folylpolyglutamate synthase/dihydrofolate synthase family protein [Acidobacteriota bacterium]
MKWLHSLERFGIRLGLENIYRLLEALGNPQNRFASVLIGGTNGKGSVAAMLQSILTRSGYSTGLYTSPHLVQVEERIRIGYDNISRQELEDALQKVKETAERLTKEKTLSGHPTFFEILTAVAFEIFALRKIKIGVVEVGMGGQFDATNVLLPVLSIITNVSMDHTDYLGTTVEKIAMEKAGIVKRYGILLTGETKGVPLNVFADACKKKRSLLINALIDSEFSLSSDGTVTIRTVMDEYKHLKIPLEGDHQIENARIAIRAAEILSDKGFAINRRNIAEGIEKTVWAGRLEWVAGDPPVLLDGAHNVAGMKVLSKYLRTLKQRGKEIRLIFGAMKDKDIEGMMKIVLPLADSVFLASPEMERAATPDDLQSLARRFNNNIRKCESLKDALRAASEKRSSRVISIKSREPMQDAVICICGSLFLVGAFKSLQTC